MRLLFASSHNPDLLAIFPHWISDPIPVLWTEQAAHIFLDQREYDQAVEEGVPGLMVERIDPFVATAKTMMDDGPWWGKVLLAICREYEATVVTVSTQFPYGLGVYLSRQGITLEVVDGLVPERRSKSLVEIQYIEQVQRCTEGAFALIEEVLTQSRIGAEAVLYFEEQPLTCELLKSMVAQHLLQQNIVLQEGIIIAHGAQGAIPHHTGHGIIRAHEGLVCDIFPRSMDSYYFADMTRTFCKGEPSPELQRMYDAVKQAQEEACAMLGPGVDGAKVHAHCKQVFISHGFITNAEEGFIHCTGHGVGLEIHEAPRLSTGSCILQPGDVVTVEPGLYYKEWGGVRIEDMVYITEDGARNLTRYPKELVIASIGITKKSDYL